MKINDYHHLNHVKEQHKSKKTLWITIITYSIFYDRRNCWWVNI